MGVGYRGWVLGGGFHIRSGDGSGSAVHDFFLIFGSRNAYIVTFMHSLDLLTAKIIISFVHRKKIDTSVKQKKYIFASFLHAQIHTSSTPTHSAIPG